MTMPEQKKAVVPRLRFPEFRDAGPWEVKRLGEVGTIIKGKGISKSDIKPNGILPCIRYGELYTHYREVIRTIVSFTDADPGDLVLSQHNDLIIPASGETKEDIATASCVMLDGVALGGDLNIFRSPIDGRFLAYYVRGNLKTQIAKVAQGDSVVHLYPSQLEKVELGVPHEPAEQQKIADCLSSLDEVIELQAKKLEALKAHKKGLMQQLFPREGETTPRLRFPEFRDAGPWEVKRLGEICSFLKGKGLPKTAITAEGSVPCIHYGELFTEYGEVIRKVKSCTNTTTDSVLSEEDDVLMPTSDVTPNGLAKASCIKEKNVVLGGDILVIRPNKQQVFGEYLSRYIRYQEKDVLRLVTGTTVFHLYGNAISHLRVSLPRVSEQQKIADCLSSLDELIELQAKQLEALKAHKKGLMQQLFPQEIDL